MTIARLRPMLDRARAEGYGVLAINVVDDLTLRAVVRAARRKRISQGMTFGR